MKICLVIGHDMDNRGSYGDAGISEFTFNDNLISEMFHKGLLPGDTYVLYRSSDIFGYGEQMKELHKRIDALKCDVSIECHFNGFHDPSVNGNEVLYCSQGGKRIADIFDEELDALPNRDRGVKKVLGNDDGAGFCCRGRSYAIIIEPFFGSHQRDYIFNGQYREILMTSLSKALHRVKGL